MDGCGGGEGVIHLFKNQKTNLGGARNIKKKPLRVRTSCVAIFVFFSHNS